MVRCFLSIDLPREIQEELSEIQKKIYSEDVKLVNVKPDKLHITLKFFGELEEDQIERVESVLSKIKFRKFKARLDSIGVFPDENFIRVVWVGVEPGEKVNEIHDKLDEDLHKEGFKLDSESESHITLARVKTIRDKKSFVQQLKSIEVKPLEFEINSLILKESILTPEGPIYNEIFKVKLQ